MPKPMLAILRSIVQLEISTPEELSECTQLTIPEVIGTLRYFESRGYIEWSRIKREFQIIGIALLPMPYTVNIYW